MNIGQIPTHFQLSEENVEEDFSTITGVPTCVIDSMMIVHICSAMGVCSEAFLNKDAQELVHIIIRRTSKFPSEIGKNTFRK